MGASVHGTVCARQTRPSGDGSSQARQTFAGLNSAELSAVQDIPMPRGVKRIPLPDSNIFGVAEDEPFHTGQEVGFRFPSMVQVSMLERQLKPHVPKDAEVGMYHSHSAPDLRGCCHKCHRSLTSQRGGLRSTKAH